jgi:hypothetical protein
MEDNDKKATPYLKRLADLEKEVEQMKLDNNSNWDWMLGLVMVASIFGDFGTNNKVAELEKRIEKLEVKNEMLEKIILK